MFTLLPEEYKNQMIGGYRKRVFIVLTIGCICVLALSLLLQFSTYMTVRAEHNKLSMEFQSLRTQTARHNNKAIGIDLNEFNLDVKLFAFNTSSVLPSLDNVFKHVVPGISISKIEYILLEGSRFNINLSGTAMRRVDLSLFNKSLKLEKTFKKVELPIESLAQEADVDFNIKIEGFYE